MAERPVDGVVAGQVGPERIVLALRMLHRGLGGASSEGNLALLQVVFKCRRRVVKSASQIAR